MIILSLGKHLISTPLQGLVEIIRGVNQAVPPLGRAVGKAVVEAVKSRLSGHDRAGIRQGIDCVMAGARLLAAPVCLAALVWLVLQPSIASIVWMASLMILIGAVGG